MYFYVSAILIRNPVFPQNSFIVCKEVLEDCGDNFPTLDIWDNIQNHKLNKKDDCDQVKQSFYAQHRRAK